MTNSSSSLVIFPLCPFRDPFVPLHRPFHSRTTLTTLTIRRVVIIHLQNWDNLIISSLWSESVKGFPEQRIWPNGLARGLHAANSKLDNSLFTIRYLSKTWNLIQILSTARPKKLSHRLGLPVDVRSGARLNFCVLKLCAFQACFRPPPCSLLSLCSMFILNARACFHGFPISWIRGI